MEKDEVFEIFSVLSKTVIIVPIIVVIVGLIYRFNKNPNLNQSQNLVMPTISQLKNNQSKISIDLKGPLVCSGKIDNQIINAFIKDKKIKVILEQKIKKENFLLNSDCYYRWQEGQYNGEKICGFSPMVAIAQTMIGFTGIDLSLITSQLTKLGIDQNIATNEARITQLIQSCKKQNINTKIFEVPDNILFKNKK